MDVFHHRNLINFCDILGRNGETAENREKDHIPDERSGQGNLGRFVVERDASERCELRGKSGRPPQLQILSAPAVGGVLHSN